MPTIMAFPLTPNIEVEEARRYSNKIEVPEEETRKKQEPPPN